MPEPLAELDEHQKRCLRLVADGYTSKEIALRIGLSPGTVDQYIHRASSALGASGRRDAARLLAELEEAEQLKRLELKPETVAEPQKSNDLELPATQPVRRIPAFLAKPLAQLGGSRHDFDRWQTFAAIFRAALWAGGTLAALIVTGFWLNRLFA